VSIFSSQQGVDAAGIISQHTDFFEAVHIDIGFLLGFCLRGLARSIGIRCRKHNRSLKITNPLPACPERKLDSGARVVAAVWEALQTIADARQVSGGGTKCRVLPASRSW
jgi:hypothetical protein